MGWIELTWWVGRGHISITARLVSSRFEGVTLICDMSPPEGRRVQISLEGGGEPQSAEAAVASVRDLCGRGYLVRLGFEAPCSRGFRRAAEAALEPVG